MNDRFKFRIWHNGIMHYNDFIITSTGYTAKIDEEFLGKCVFNQENLEFDKQVVIMQCTGLKDSNGRLIYEGDIVEVQYIGGQIPLFKNEYVNEPESERFQIYWNENWCSWSGKNDNYRGRCEIHSLDISKFLINTDNKIYEVIGNIYENEELLKV